MMKGLLSVLMLLVMLFQSALAQDHLIPDTGVLVDPDNYKVKIRHVFLQAFEEDVILRAIVVPSSRDEYAVGLRATNGGHEAFVLEPSSNIWATELLTMYETGELGSFNAEGTKIPFKENEDYKELKQRTPADYHTIKSARRARAVSRVVAARIMSLWETMLLEVKHSREINHGMDGITYHFSMRARGRGDLSGHVWSPKPESRTGRLAKLADVLADFARGKSDVRALSEQVERLGKSVPKRKE